MKLLLILTIGGSLITGSNAYAQSADKPAFQGFYAGIGAGLNSTSIEGSVITETRTTVYNNGGLNLSGGSVLNAPNIFINGVHYTQAQWNQHVAQNSTYSAYSQSGQSSISESSRSGNIDAFAGYNYRKDQFLIGVEAGANKLLSSLHGDISHRFSVHGGVRIGTIMQFNSFADPEVLVFAKAGVNHAKYSDSVPSSTNFTGGLGVEKRLTDKMYLRLSYSFTPGKTISSEKQISDLKREKTTIKLGASHAILIGTAIHF